MTARLLIAAFSFLLVGCGAPASESTSEAEPRAEPEAERRATALEPGSETGLLDAPLPEGAVLIEESPGDPANGVDPSQRYEIDATSGQIMSFYENAMPTAGWQMDSVVSRNSRFFRKGGLMIGVLSNDEGGTFTLMGS